MLKSSDRHLTEQELDLLAGFGTHLVASSAEAGTQDESAVLHVSTCQRCREQLGQRMAANGRLAALKTSSKGERGPSCPADEEWMNVVAGLTDQNESTELIDHAAGCAYCGPLLRQTVDDFSDSVSPDEATLMSQLGSTTPEWRTQLAERLSASKPSQESSAPQTVSLGWLAHWRRPVTVLAGLVLAVAVVWFLLPRPEAHVQKLIAQAYTEHRPMEMRIAGAAYGPLRIERGQQSSHLGNSAELLEAETLIARNLTKHPVDPFWLQSRARTELLEGNYAGATENLRQALAINPQSGSLLTDLASAYFQRAIALDQSADLGQAIDLLGRSLTINPHDPVALFNRAVVAEKLFLFSQAVEDWQAYLEIDGTSPWAGEARSRLKALQDKLQKHSLERDIPLLAPKAFGNLTTEDVGREVDPRIEEYYKLATVEWFSVAFPLPTEVAEKDTHEFRSAISELAEISVARHGDHWMSDLLAQPESRRFPYALHLLSDARRANDNGDFASALRNSSAAKMEFRATQNIAGETRAALEELYALRLTQQGLPCVRAARDLADQLAKTHYTWMIIQTRIELAICYDITGNPVGAVSDSRQAVADAEHSAYHVSYLRALLVSSVLSTPSTSSPLKWSSDMAGLADFWRDIYPPMTGYNFYTDLDALAENSELPYLEFAILQQAVQTLGPDPDLLLRAVLHSRLAAVALRIGRPDLSTGEYVESDRLFRLAPPSTAAKSGQLESQVWLARIESRQHKYQAAEQRLSSIQAVAPQLTNQYVVMNFYQALAEVRLELGDLAAVDIPARAAVALAEHELSAIRSDNERLEWNREASPAYKTMVECYLKKGDTEGALELWEWYRGADLRTFTRTVPSDHVPGIDPHYRSFDLTSLPTPPPVPVLARVVQNRKQLSNQTVVAYAVFPNGVEVWDYDDRSIDAHWIAVEESSLTQTIHQYLRLCSDPASDTSVLSAKARELYDLLIAPVAHSLSPRRTLIIEPDGILGSIPFGTLLTPAGEYLTTVTAIAVSPGLYFSLTSRSIPLSGSSSNALVVGSPALGISSPPGMQPLPDAGVEARSVASRFSHAQILTGVQATIPAVQQRIAKSNVFHFAGHAISSPGDTALLLAPTMGAESRSGRLGSEEINPWQLQELQLVVLSACGTENSSGDTLADPENLVFFFLRKGIPHVVATRWNVDSASATGWVDQFYSHLLHGESVPEALRAASAQMRLDPSRRHPYFWAAFDSFGQS